MNHQKRKHLGLGAGFLLSSLMAAGTALGQERQTRHQTLEIDGLDAPVQIRKDQWGISHIYAENQADLFFAQGFNVARDRLFQLELWRRRATDVGSSDAGTRPIRSPPGWRAAEVYSAKAFS